MLCLRRSLLCGFALCFVAIAQAQEDAPGGYVFTGVAPYKVHKKQLCPVLGVAKKRLLIQTDSGVKRIRFGQGSVSLRQTIVATAHRADIANLVLSFENRAQFRRDGALQAALDADIEYAQAKMDEIDTTDKPVVSGQPQGMSKEEFRQSLSQESSASRQLSDAIGSMGSRKADTIYLTFEIVPESDFEDTFAAVVVSFDKRDDSGSISGRYQVPSLEMTGDLQAGVPNEVSIEVMTPEQLLSNIDLKVYLFTQGGEPIATNLSGLVRKMPSGELEQSQ